MTDDERAAIEAAVKACLEWECPTCKDTPHVDYGWVENDNWLYEEDRWIPCPTCRGNGDGDFREQVGIVAAMLAPLLAAKDERIAELRRTLSRLHDEADFAYQYLEDSRAESKSHHAKLHANLGAAVDEAWALLRATRPSAALSPAAETTQDKENERDARA